ncbi:MAG: tRNA (adenosine(37)-N6)-dimethylallyltransferase MiaA, partial [Candidatus Fimimonas sp.]
MKTFVGITGTTCVGKSDVAVQLAKLMQTEIISADSMQIYKGMDIGTAKISQAEMQGITHHMLDVACPNEDFSSFQYQLQASKIIDEATTTPIVVGGTGFYFDSLLYPPEFGGGNLQLRKQLQEVLATEGLQKLQERLRQKDEYAYNTIDLNNPVRVVRALEIAESGEQRQNGKGKTAPKYNCVLFVLQRNREQLYRMIDGRVDKMIGQGLVNEVSEMVQRY